MKAIPLFWSFFLCALALGMQGTEAPWKHFEYVCDDKSRVGVDLRGQDVRVTFKDHVYRMKQTIAASGTRYSDGKIVWWSKGREGFITTESENEMLAKGCQLSTPGTITGTATYRERIAMPPDAVLVVQLKDVSRVDAPGKIVAEQRVPFNGRQVPIAFELTFDPSKINPKNTYSVNAQIVVGDQLRFVSDTSQRVLTSDNPFHTELVLVAAHR